MVPPSFGATIFVKANSRSNALRAWSFLLASVAWLSTSSAWGQALAPPSDTPVSDGSTRIDEGQRVVELRVEGNRRVEQEPIRRALRTKVGNLFDPTQTADDLRALWALGYFQNVQLLIQRLPRGIAYVVRVEERPAIREVKLEGNDEISKDDLKEAIDVKPFSILDREAIKRNEKKIQEKYVDKGFQLAEVTHRLDPVADAGNQVDLVFVVRENAKVQVKQIRFIGAKKVAPEELRAVMATREASFLSFFSGEGTYREELFQRDQAIIQAVYLDRGFVNVRVDPPVVSLSADKRDIYVTIKIEEGEQYRIGKLDFSGDLLRSKDKLGELITSEEGELFNRSKLQTDILAITDIYQDDGYAYANINPQHVLHPEERTIDLTFDIQQGKKVYIERIEIVGNGKTRDQVMRREMRVYEGELFSGSGIRRSKERINALGFFETVEVSHKPGSDDEKVVVRAEVKEKQTGTFQVGLGFSNVENWVFTAQISQNNFLGWGQAVSASAQVSSLRSFAQLSFFDPHVFDTDFIFSTDFFRMEADYLGFIRSSTGGNIGVGRHLLEDVTANLTYSREYVRVGAGRDVDTIPLAGRTQNGVTSSLRLSGTWDRRDNRLFPTKGFVHFGSVEVAPDFLGGTLNFTRLTGYSRFYFPLFLGIVFKTNTQAGIINPLGDAKLPISELYYLGGINTIRGYFLRTITPEVLVGNSLRGDSYTSPFPVGGNKQFIFNAELEFPIFEKVGIKGVIFYDAGNAFAPNERFFQDLQDPVPLGLFHSTGFGFRWFSPIGPLRFEWGFPLTPRPTDQRVLFEFTIGNSF